MKSIDQFEELIEKVSQLEHTKDHVVVAVSGFGGSGKTTLAEKIKNHFSNSTWVQIDNFLINRGRGEGWAGGYDWDRFESVLNDIKAGKDLHYQWYDWHRDGLSDRWIDEKLPRLIVVEGSRILQPGLMKYYDFSVWIDIDLDKATERGKARDKRNWQDESDKNGLEAHLNTWHTTWAPKDKEYFEKFQPNKLANFIYDTSDSPKPA